MPLCIMSLLYSIQLFLGLPGELSQRLPLFSGLLHLPEKEKVGWCLRHFADLSLLSHGDILCVQPLPFGLISPFFLSQSLSKRVSSECVWGRRQGKFPVAWEDSTTGSPKLFLRIFQFEKTAVLSWREKDNSMPSPVACMKREERRRWAWQGAVGKCHYISDEITLTLSFSPVELCPYHVTTYVSMLIEWEEEWTLCEDETILLLHLYSLLWIV